MNFQIQHSIRGTKGCIIAFFGGAFASSGLLFITMIDADKRYSWPGAFVLVPILIGMTILGMVAYAIFKNWTYSMEVSENTLKWRRVDLNREIGRVELVDISKIIFTQGNGEDYSSLVAHSRFGEEIVIPLEFLNGAKDIEKLLAFIGSNFQTIEIIRT